MNLRTPGAKKPTKQVMKDVCRATRLRFAAEDKIRIALTGLRGASDGGYLIRPPQVAAWSRCCVQSVAGGRNSQDPPQRKQPAQGLQDR